MTPAVGERDLPKSRYATAANAKAIQSGTTIRSVEPGGSNPLAPTRLHQTAPNRTFGRAVSDEFTSGSPGVIDVEAAPCLE